MVQYVSNKPSNKNRAKCIGSVWCGSATTIDTEVPWRCSWPCLCATAATSIFDASSGLCQLCHGSSLGRFLFQSWASHCFVYYMFGAYFGVCFLLSGALLDAIFTPGSSTIGICTFPTLWCLLVAGICATRVIIIGPHQACTVTAPSTNSSRGEPSATQSPSHLYGVAYHFGALAVT